MASRNERREISALHRASNGQGDSPQDSSKKRLRPREDDTSANEVRRRRGLVTNPFAGIGHDNLQASRVNSRRTLKRESSPDIIPTGSRPSGTLGHSVFAMSTSPRSGVLDDFEPSGVATHDAQSSSHHPPSIQDSPPGISHEISAKMDGLGEAEGTLSLAAVLGEARIPVSPGRQVHGAKEPGHRSDGRSRSSSDPINCIGGSVGASNLTKQNSDEDEIVEYEPSAPTRPRQSVPAETSIVKKGTVKKAVRKIESGPSTRVSSSASPSAPVRTEGNLDGYLVPKSFQSSGTFSSAAARGTSTKHTPSGPTSKGNIIPIGITRPQAIPGKFSNRMHGKPTPTGKTQTSQLKIQSVGTLLSQDQKSLQRGKPRDTKAPDTWTLKIQEWYCEPNHYESNASQGSYRFNFNGAIIRITFSERPGVESKELCLIRDDIEAFEVVDTNEDESYLWMMIFLKDRFISRVNWQRDGLGESGRVLLHFLESDDPNIHDCWKGLVQGMAKWAQKRTIKKSIMDGLVKGATDRSSFHVPKVQDIAVQAPQRELKPEPKSRTPPSKPRTRSSVSNSNRDDPDKDKKPIVIQDPDEVVLVHPTGAGSVTVNQGELARLEPGEFLNDTLIELGLKMWLNELRLKDPTLVDQIHVFSSFFFKKLDAGRGKGCDYNSVKKWTSKFDLFSKRFIIIPINEHLHWYLAIICFPEHVLEAPFPPAQPTRVTRSSDATTKAEQRMSSESDMQIDPAPSIDGDAGSPTVLGKMEVDTELADKSGKIAIDSPPESQPDVVDVDPGPNEPTVVDVTIDESEDKISSQGTSVIKSEKTWILILDSLGGKHPRTIRILREYLQAEAQERRGRVVDIQNARSSGGLVEDKHLSVPVQPNWCDCGVYLLHYVEVFYANPLEIITLPPGAKRKPREAGSRYDELWRTDQVKDKRTVFRQQLHELSARWLESKSSTPKDTAPIPGTLPLSTTTGSVPLSHIQTDTSILEIDPPTRNVSSVIAADSTDPTSALTPGLLEYPTSPSTTIKDVEEVEEIVRPPESPLTPKKSTIDLSSDSSQPSSNSKSTRRGKKSGPRHGSRPSLDHEVNHAPEIVTNQTPEREVSVDL